MWSRKKPLEEAGPISLVWLRLRLPGAATAAVAVSTTASASASIVVRGGAGRTPGSQQRNEERRPGPALRPGLGPRPGSREGNGAPRLVTLPRSAPAPPPLEFPQL